MKIERAHAELNWAPSGIMVEVTLTLKKSGCGETFRVLRTILLTERQTGILHF
jgi:hypothetical protein